MISRPWRKREPVVAEYLEACRHRPSRNVDVADNTVIVLDGETTGFDLVNDRLLSLATLEIKRREIHVSRMHSWLVYQETATLNEAVRVHGILPAETAQGRPEAAVIRELLPVIGGHLLVGHHIRFDYSILQAIARRHLGIRLRNRVLDTAVLAMRELAPFHRTGYPNQRPPSLEEVCAHLDVPMMERHTASGDTFTTAEIFLLLCARMRRRLGRPLQFRDLPLL
jgi:DNA polymerase-3 subunit epsilon